MIEMRVMGIALDTRTGSPIVVLNDKENRKALPIWIGSAEASAIIRKIENIPSTRPMTHDLFIQIAEKSEYEITKIEINEINKLCENGGILPIGGRDNHKNVWLEF